LTDKSTINKSKQINALMPNLVHSLDSSALFLLYDVFKNTDRISGKVNFYSIHDCFGVSATEIYILINLLRSVYIQLYSDNRYIETFDNDSINFIINYLSNEETKVNYDKEKRFIYNYDHTIYIELPPLPINTDILDKDKIKYFSKLKKIFITN
jgi:DNA-directed RNA polymerase